MTGFPKIAVIRSGKRRALIIDGEQFPYPTFGGYQIHVGADELPNITVGLVADSIEVHDNIDSGEFDQLTEQVAERTQPKIWAVHYCVNNTRELVDVFATLEKAKATTNVGIGDAADWQQDTPTQWHTSDSDGGIYYATEWRVR